MSRDVLPTAGPVDDRLVEACLADPRLRRLAPFYHLASRADPGALSEQHARALREAYRRSLHGALLQHRELERLLAAFAERDVPVIPLKGTLLGLRLYGELGRPSADLDLFVRAEDVARSTELLEALGYAAHEDVGRYDVLFHRGEPPQASFVELHRSLGYLSRSAQGLPAHVWSGARVDRVADLDCWRMDASDELLYLCLNLVKHRFSGPFLALDVHLALERWRGELDLARLVEAARRFRLGDQVMAALLYARRWFGTALPAELEASLRLPSWKRAWLERVEWPVGSASGARLPAPPAHLHLALLLLLFAETGRDRLGYLDDALSVARRRLGGRRRRAIHSAGL